MDSKLLGCGRDAQVMNGRFVTNQDTLDLIFPNMDRPTSMEELAPFQCATLQPVADRVPVNRERHSDLPDIKDGCSLYLQLLFRHCELL